MADNTQINTGTGDIISTDAITTLNGRSIATGEKAQRVKVGWGDDGAYNDASAMSPLPVLSPSIEYLLLQILIELRVQNITLATTLNSRDDLDQLRAGESASAI